MNDDYNSNSDNKAELQNIDIITRLSFQKYRILSGKLKHLVIWI